MLAIIAFPAGGAAHAPAVRKSHFPRRPPLLRTPSLFSLLPQSITHRRPVPDICFRFVGYNKSMSPRFAFLVLASSGLFVLGLHGAVGKSPAEAAAPALITYNNQPLGSLSAPLLLRTYLPDPDLDDAVFAHHDRGYKTPEYSPEKGADAPGEVIPLHGIPAGIAVNLGPALSYVFDTTEGRLLYAWQGGFLDMYPYWGDKGLGTRIYDYVPRLMGTLFYKAAGRNPLEIDGRSVDEFGPPHFVGYDLVDGQPTFIVRHGAYTVKTRVRPVAESLGFRLELSVDPAARLSYRSEDSRLTLDQRQPAAGSLDVALTGVSLGTYEAYSRKVTIKTASVAAGAELYRNYSCAICHSTDGSVGHGPSYAGLFDSVVSLADGTSVKADEAYLLESIKEPNAKITKGFPANFMPPYSQLQQVEYDSLILFIKSLARPE